MKNSYDGIYKDLLLELLGEIGLFIWIHVEWEGGIQEEGGKMAFAVGEGVEHRRDATATVAGRSRVRILERRSRGMSV